MGEMTDSFMDYAQPLLDATDGSDKQWEAAFQFASVCRVFAMLSETELEEKFPEIMQMLGMDEDEFAEFKQSTIWPMIERHHEMFPDYMLENPLSSSSLHEEAYPGTGRNAPCPCKSGLKYKKCCGK